MSLRQAPIYKEAGRRVTAEIAYQGGDNSSTGGPRLVIWVSSQARLQQRSSRDQSPPDSYGGFRS